jgi:DNA topoisomerase-1
MKNLVIVESPAKAKTIEKYLGEGYKVTSSMGHIRDLPKKDMGLDIANGFAPIYEISPDKKKMVAELKKMAKEADTVWLATDEDREGEAIAWHLAEALNLDITAAKRIVFHEITKTAITRAIDSPRTIDLNLVNAQQARRVLDRLVGFELSPVLWKKVKGGLSAGRVQSVAVRVIVEREREINDFIPEATFKVKGNFETMKGAKFAASLLAETKEKDQALKWMRELQSATFKVESLEKKPAKRSPSAPFTTSTLQQEASLKLGYPVSLTMRIAQKLYESGLITYMRTDSVNLSKEATDSALHFISSEYGNRYSQPRTFTSKSKGAQEAHEAIRPTDSSKKEAGSTPQEKKLYNLIWKRMMASQMSDAELERTIIRINNSSNKEIFEARGEVIKFDGFMKLYMESRDEDESTGEEGLLPDVAAGEALKLLGAEARQRFTKHLPRYSEASLVKKLEELGIGRPSTYAPTISTIQNRGYVVKEDREAQQRKVQVILLDRKGLHESEEMENHGAERNKLFPTDMGSVVTDYLVAQFSNILDYNFTARVEEEFDDIASGQKPWNDMIGSFYKDFHQEVVDAESAKGRADGTRLLGTDPASGENVYVKVGRYGSMVQIGEGGGEIKPKFASLRAEHNLETITLDEAMELFKLPKKLGEWEGAELEASVGRFGPYVKWGKGFYSLPKGSDPGAVSRDEAIEFVKTKMEEAKNKSLNSFKHADGDIEILKGMYGPYVKRGKTNYKIPKGKEAAELTLEDCLDIIANHKPSPRSKARVKK